MLSARQEGLTLEARRAESGGGVLGEGAASPWGGDSEPPPHQLGGLGQHCELPQWGLGQSPGKF